MVRIRLRRMGTKHQPSYRIVVVDSRAARDSAYIDIIGHYHPKADPPDIVLNEEKAITWLRQGAQPSEPVKRMLQKLNVFERVKSP